VNCLQYPHDNRDYKTGTVAESVFRSYPVSVGEALDALDARTLLARLERVLVKQNLDHQVIKWHSAGS